MNHSETPASPRPSVWVLSGHKAGDNTQMLALADALAWPYEVKKLRYRFFELLTNRLLGVTLAGIDVAASSPLVPPWPDLIITAGRRNEPVARWIRRQSGNSSRIVHLGRPWASPDIFDLVIVTPQYFVPKRSNVLCIDLPLHALTRTQLDETAAQWQARVADLPRPYWTVLLGGNSGPLVFDRRKARRLANWLNRVLLRSGGSILVSDSARTPERTYRTFLTHLKVPVRAFHWGKGEENPYPGFLALADHLVVTGDSMSMLAEAVAACRPLYVFDLSDCPQWGDESRSRCLPWWLYPHNFRYRPLVHRLAMWLGPQRMKRDVRRLQGRLIESGRAVWAGQDWRGDTRPEDTADLEQAVRRVRALCDLTVV